MRLRLVLFLWHYMGSNSEKSLGHHTSVVDGAFSFILWLLSHPHRRRGVLFIYLFIWCYLGSNSDTWLGHLTTVVDEAFSFVLWVLGEVN
jgi:hypothetical protein